MADVKVRCMGCGAKNSNDLAERCRVCGTVLPDANRRRSAAITATTSGPAFADLVESEVAAWKEYAEGRNRGTRSRRPEELDNPSKSRWSLRRSKDD